MSRTKHIQQRMSQRGISQRLIDIVKDFGWAHQRNQVSEIILNRKAIDKALGELDHLRKDLIHARGKGGIVVVSSTDGVDITTYALR